MIIVSVRFLCAGFSGFRFLGFQVFGFSGFQVFWFRFFGRDRTQGFRTGWVKMGRRARQYYSNSLKYSKIQIYSNKFTQNCKFSGSLNFYKTWKHILFQNSFPHFILALINKNNEVITSLQNIIQILSLFLKK